MICKNRLNVFVAIMLTLCVSCTTTEELDSKTQDQTTSNFSWIDKDSLIAPLIAVLADECPNFISDSANAAFIQDYPDFNARSFEINGATIIVYLDGAIEPEMEDEISTNTYYEKWGCTKDTLFLEGLRFSESDFYGMPKPVFVFDCVDQYRTKLKNVIITCADANMGIEGISWDSWNTLEASGTGDFYENNCAPDCATGSIVRQRATIHLSGVELDSFGKKVFTEVIVQTDQKQQSGGYTDTYPLNYEK